LDQRHNSVAWRSQRGEHDQDAVLPVVICAGDELQGRRVDESWLLFFFVGLLAQLVDGANKTLFFCPPHPIERPVGARE
jgi:hypothetical protein